MTSQSISGQSHREFFDWLKSVNTMAASVKLSETISVFRRRISLMYRLFIIMD